MPAGGVFDRSDGRAEPMRVIALEEHFFVPALIGKHIPPALSRMAWTDQSLAAALSDLGERRLRDMDEGGIDLQILSATMPGADLVDGARGIEFARSVNDQLAAAVRRCPDRLAGFAHLPMREPEAAAEELERTISDLDFHGAMVNGLTEDRFLDDPRFDRLLATAARLDVPVYIHPNLPPKAVADIYYHSLPAPFDTLLATGVFGWHAEVGIHVLRLALSGVFERHPGLTVIIGHMGEMLPFMLGRADEVLSRHGGLSRPISKTIVEHVYITTSGFFTDAPFLNALATFGVDRIMYSVDYPFNSNLAGKGFLEALPVSPEDKAKIAHGNAERLFKLPRASNA